MSDEYKKSDGKSFNKLWAYFKDLTKETTFLYEVEEIRDKYKGKNMLDYQELIDDYANFPEDIYKLAYKYGLDGLAWFDTLVMFILENELIKPASNYNATDLCQTVDIDELALEATAWQVQERIGKIYPVILRISPYASSNDILDYVKKNYTKLIKPLQVKFKDKNSDIGKKKRKKSKNEERDDFIFKNRALSLKKIQGLIAKEFGPEAIIDQGYISKIISREKDKRSELF